MTAEGAGSRSRFHVNPADALVAALAGVAGWRVLLTVLEAPRHSFAETRLMPLFLTLAGRSPYALPGDGACYVPMYPPLAFLPYAPAALFDGPVGVLRAGAALTLLFAFLPVVFLLRLSCDGEDAARRTVLALAALVFLVHVSPVLVTAVFIHADTPAVALAAAGAALLVLASRRSSGGLLVLSAVVLSLVPWAKHVFFPAVLLPPLALASRGQARRAAAHLALAGALQACWAGLFALLFGGAGLKFWLLDFPGLHPWIGKPHEILALSNRVLLSLVVVELAALAGAAIALRERLALRTEWSRHPWAVLSVAGLLLWPSSLIGYVKVGGALNSFLPTTFFLTSALLLLLVDRGATGAVPLPARAPEGALLVASALLGAQVALESAIATATLSRTAFEPAIAFETLRRNPDEVFFPWFPMTTRLATGRFDHSELGIRERELGGVAVGAAQLRAAVPRRLRFVACGKDACPSTLAHFSVVNQRTISTPSGSWTIHEVAPLSPR